ncbi:unnamed protein product [Linum trigynum]|uniref:Uncharacterized protein n=1 Tax=Linum trigynum TaxID=586398 RepID=A0AAV2EGW5_9ROSI
MINCMHCIKIDFGHMHAAYNFQSSYSYHTLAHNGLPHLSNFSLSPIGAPWRNVGVKVLRELVCRFRLGTS